MPRLKLISLGSADALNWGRARKEINGSVGCYNYPITNHSRDLHRHISVSGNNPKPFAMNEIIHGYG